MPLCSSLNAALDGFDIGWRNQWYYMSSLSSFYNRWWAGTLPLYSLCGRLPNSIVALAYCWALHYLILCAGNSRLLLLGVPNDEGQAPIQTHIMSLCSVSTVAAQCPSTRLALDTLHTSAHVTSLQLSLIPLATPACGVGWVSAVCILPRSQTNMASSSLAMALHDKPFSFRVYL